MDDMAIHTKLQNFESEDHIQCDTENTWKESFKS
jgi:hypothetical protein